MEEALRDTCKDYVQGHKSLTALKNRLRALLDDATADEMLEFCHTVIEGLADEKGH